MNIKTPLLLLGLVMISCACIDHKKQMGSNEEASLHHPHLEGDNDQLEREDDQKADDFTDFVFDFLDVCFYENNLNRLIRDNDPRLKPYIDPKMGVRRYYAPGAFAYLAGADEHYGFQDYDDFSFLPEPSGEIILTKLSAKMSVCELEFKNNSEVFYETLKKLPEAVVNADVENIKTKPVVLPYPKAKIRAVYVPDNFNNPVGLYFVLTPKGWKFAFINDALCEA